MSARSAFVTGATGFVGGALCTELRRAGWQVTALVRDPAKAQPLAALGVQLARGDILEADSLRTALAAGTDTVFHVAGDTAMWFKQDARQTAVNVDGTANVLAAARGAGVRRFVQTSTISAYGPQSGTVTETTPSRAPTSFVNYERSKFEADQQVRAAIADGLDAVIVQPGAIIGAGDRSNWGRMFVLARAGKLAFLPPGELPFNHIDQIVAAHIAAAERGRCGEAYLLGGAPMRLADLVAGIHRRLGKRPPGLRLPAGVLEVMGRIVGTLTPASVAEPLMTRELAALLSTTVRADCTKASRELGLKPTSLDECLDDSHRWLLAEGLL